MTDTSQWVQVIELDHAESEVCGLNVMESEGCWCRDEFF